MQSYHGVAACAGYTGNAVTSKAIILFSGAPDTRAQHSLLNSESGKRLKKKSLRLSQSFAILGTCSLLAVVASWLL